MLDKKAALFARDENGELIPLERELVIDETDMNQLKLKGESIAILPLTRGELKKLFGIVGLNKPIDVEKKTEEDDLDADIIEKYCKVPKLTREEIAFLKPGLAPAIVNTILFESGLDVKRTARKAFEKAEDDFAKNSEELNQTEKKAI